MSAGSFFRFFKPLFVRPTKHPLPLAPERLQALDRVVTEVALTDSPLQESRFEETKTQYTLYHKHPLTMWLKHAIIGGVICLSVLKMAAPALQSLFPAGVTDMAIFSGLIGALASPVYCRFKQKQTQRQYDLAKAQQKENERLYYIKTETLHQEHFPELFPYMASKLVHRKNKVAQKILEASASQNRMNKGISLARGAASVAVVGLVLLGLQSFFSLPLTQAVAAMASPAFIGFSSFFAGLDLFIVNKERDRFVDLQKQAGKTDRQYYALMSGLCYKQNRLAAARAQRTALLEKARQDPAKRPLFCQLCATLTKRQKKMEQDLMNRRPRQGRAYPGLWTLGGW